jgi:hypothetical protein
MITNIIQLFVKPIQWIPEVPGGIEFYAYLEGDLCQLTLNDFPEEPLYTLRWKDASLDFNDRPGCWYIPPS